MVDRVPREAGPPPSRFDGWLLKSIRGGRLKTLPRYFPTGERVGHCPERYARALLAGLRTFEGDRRRIERVRDDGRAFRSWVESVVPAFARGAAS
jgi:hypothetical protein